MKMSYAKVLVLIIVGIFVGSCLRQENAHAYWNENKNKTFQCFAVQYKKLEEHNDPGGVVGGTQLKRVVTGVYSTNQICAKVDSDGKAVGPLYYKARPKNTTPTKLYPELKVDDKNPRQINMFFCGDGSAKCDPPLSYSYSVENKSFREVAETVVRQAQATYNNNKAINKVGIDENITKKSVGEEANKTNSENYKDAVENGYGNRCKASGGANALGWIVCPILEWLSDAADNIYDEYVEPSLRIEPQLFTNDESSVEVAWDTFRNFANIVFVILLLAVIISQLTGVGIDNYGIKKALPKLIVAAILINLSYIICILAVDISNILGNSFQSLFKSLGDNLYLQSLSIEGQNIPLSNDSNSLMTTGLTGVGLLALLVGGGFAIFSNPAILLSLFVSALGIVIAIFFLFILLSMREAAIIVLIVVSPLAFVAYILPNTKKLFDKWLSFFKGLLIVYPVCGLLVGSGNYVSRLLLAANIGEGGFIAAFTAMIVGVLPIFFIPMVIRSAFNAMGAIGSRLAGLGGRLGNTATGAMRGSQAYRNAQELGAERATRLRAGVDENGKAYKMGRLATFMSGGSRNVARARSQYLSNQDTRNREENLLGSGYDATMAGIEDKAKQQKVADFEALMTSGRVIGADGEPVNTNDPSSVSTFHANALGRYNNAKTAAEKEVAMTQIQAAQNMLMKTTAGRDSMQGNLEAYARASQASGLSKDEREAREEGLRKASSHIMGQYGDKLKATNRGSHAMIQAMASGTSMSDVVDNINANTYDATGASKYTSETLAMADDGAIDRLERSLGSMSAKDLADIQSTASGALRQEAAGKLSLKPEVRRKMQNIAGWSGPPPAP
ncbi:hypothetical protein IKD67_01245 [Candidatus Saccharibacteria bacterium]|nr:hypothetical protein [Candidatus Saccharibacteria bacterium]